MRPHTTVVCRMRIERVSQSALVPGQVWRATWHTVRHAAQYDERRGARRGQQHAARLSAHSTAYGAPEHFYAVIDQVVSNASNGSNAANASNAASASNAANAAIPPFRPLGSSFAFALPSQAVSCIRFAASHRRPRRIGLCAPDTIRPASRMPDTKADGYHGR